MEDANEKCEHAHSTTVEDNSYVFEENNVQGDNSEQDDKSAQYSEFDGDPYTDSEDNGGVSAI